ncbi:MAG: flagellar biosynthesis anti-sigma factor FlgM [bacterium]|jgi:flagellar biosynthesis anti-sigma factor FlgM
MRIPGIERLFSIVNARLRGASEVARPSGAPKVGPDKVEISDNARARLSQNLAPTDPRTRAEKLAEIKSQLERGEYRIDEEAVARGLDENGYFDDIKRG